MKAKRTELPIINVRDHVIFPNTYSNLFIGRKFTIEALEMVRKTGQQVIVASQKKGEKEDPRSLSDVYQVGTLCKLQKCVSFPDDTMIAKLEGICPVQLTDLRTIENVRHAKFKRLSNPKASAISKSERNDLIELLIRWNPASAIHPESNMIQELSKSQTDKLFLRRVLQRFMYFPKPDSKEQKSKNNGPQFTKEMNMSVANRQKVIEETSSKRQIQLIRSTLLKESMQTLKNLAG